MPIFCGSKYSLGINSDLFKYVNGLVCREGGCYVPGSGFSFFFRISLSSLSESYSLPKEPHRGLMKTSSIAVETSRSTTQSDSIVRQTNKRSSYLSYTTMNNKHIFNDIELKYGRTALRLIRRHERCSRKLARYNNHLTFLTRCIKSHIIPRDLRVQPLVPTKGARRVAEVASMRFLRERI